MAQKKKRYAHLLTSHWPEQITWERKDIRITILSGGKYQKIDLLFKTQKPHYSPKVLHNIGLRNEMFFSHEFL